jgi:phosphoribosylaminoimidazole-succinocarboxamide synthase
MSTALFETKLSGLERLSQGKVRDIYVVDDERLLIVTTDRLSAFDVILPNPIPGKGEVLTQVANFWFHRTGSIIANHLTGISPAEVIPDADECAALGARGLVVKRLQPLPVEAVVRGYVIGSGWKDYQQNGGICGIALPAGLKLAQRLPEPIFTPATKAAVGDHDENIDFATMTALVGDDLAARIRDLSLQLYAHGAAHARERGIIIADTKFEFGLDAAGELHLIDEVMTPDSSRFWPAESYLEGVSPPSYDKQFVRDYLETLDWDKTAPGPELPAHIIEQTAAKYRLAMQQLTGA